MTDVGLQYERDWLAPRPVPRRSAAPVRVHVLYRVDLGGRFTAKTLAEFRDALAIEQRGRLEDDAEQFFGERYLRNEDNRLIRLLLARTFDGDWYMSCSYQGTPPDPATIDQVARDIRAAAARAGLRVRHEQHISHAGGDA
jgi:hypothetical protein